MRIKDYVGCDELLEGKRGHEDTLVCYGGGGKAPTVQAVEPTPPPPPPPAEEATLEAFEETEDVKKKKREASTKGAKSLQIPLGGNVGDSGTIGTI